MKINFTSENEARLKALFVELGFTGLVLAGKFGANQYTVWDLLHNLNISTLRQLNKGLKTEISALEEQDEWSVNKAASIKASQTRKWAEFVNLVVGYKLYQNELAEEAARNKELKQKKLALLKHIKDEKEIQTLGTLTLEELEAQIAELEK